MNKTNLPKLTLLSIFFLISSAIVCLAEAATNSPSGIGSGVATAPGPSAWAALIPLAVPVGLAVLKMMAPNLPTFLLPILAPLLGAGADIALHYAGAATLGPAWGAVLGSAGVGLREIGDQLKKKVGAAPTTPPAS